jgi:hypothetical protein
MYPPHVIAILPVGIILHLVYLTTKSFWTPVLFHFLNNAMSVVAIKLFDVETMASPAFCLIAAPYVVAGLYWLWRERTRYFDQQENEVGPNYPAAEAPAMGMNSERRTPYFPLTLIAAAIITVLELVIVSVLTLS